MKDWWQKLSPPNKRSGLLFWVVIALILTVVMTSFISVKYVAYGAYLMMAVMGTIVFGTPIYLIWKIYSAYLRTKEAPDYRRIRLALGLMIMSLTALIWIGALILILIASTRGGEGVPFGIFIIPALIFGAIGESLTKSAFPSDEAADSIPPA